MNDVPKTIKLNGKTYDASSGKAIDNVVRPHARPHTKLAAQTMHSRQERPKTLMRDIVKQPAAKTHKVATKPSNTAHTFNPMPIAVSAERIARAKVVQRSQLVSRFASLAASESLIKRTEKLAVKKPPADIISHHSAPILIPVAPTPTASSLFNDAMQKATSHSQKATKNSARRHRIAKKLGVSSKVFAVSSGTLAAVLLAGFFAYQNAPNASFRVAAARAGVKAKLPGYKPSGFAMRGPVQSAPGEITVSFRSNSDNRAFTVSQKLSNWDSSALRNNYVASTSKDYQTLEDSGRTVYIYNDSSATWVDGGIWYRIEGNSSLTSMQLLHIAASM
jgi:hypothetical protein